MDPYQNFKFQLVMAVLPLLMMVLLIAGAQDAEASSNPRLAPPQSNLGPSPDTPMFIAVHAQLGGAAEFESGLLGYGAELVFRPGAAVNFLSFLYNWNAGLCMQIDYQNVSENESILSGDFIVRKYLQDMRDPKSSGSTFAGLGVGASRVDLPPGSSGAKNSYWSLVGEVGREWTLNKKYIMWLKGQYRYYDYSGYNYSCWAIQAGVGIPVPW